MLITQTMFLLEGGQTDRQTDRQMQLVTLPPSRLPPPGVGNKCGRLINSVDQPMGTRSTQHPPVPMLSISQSKQKGWSWELLFRGLLKSMLSVSYRVLWNRRLGDRMDTVLSGHCWFVGPYETILSLWLFSTRQLALTLTLYTKYQIPILTDLRSLTLSPKPVTLFLPYKPRRSQP